MLRATSISSFALLVGLSACGGGSSGGSTPATGPVASGQSTPTPAPSGQSTPTPIPAAPLATASLGASAGFVNAAGRTVYVFDADLASPGQSACSGGCAIEWPPVAPPAGTLPALWASLARGDGSMELVYSGRPLYTFLGDAQAGQTNGDGLVAFGGAWHIARPAASATAAPTTAPGPGGGY